MDISQNYCQLNRELEQICEGCARNVQDIQILAVIKHHDDVSVQSLIHCGLKMFGENQVQEAEKRSLNLYQYPYHFLGAIQSNKIRKIVKNFNAIQSIDSMDHVQKINQILQESNRTISGYIQVNIGEEKQKRGVSPDQLIDFSQEILNYDRINLKGLMCVAPYFENLEKVRPFFKEMATLNLKLKKTLNQYAGELSMGMSHDFSIAIEEGSTMIRIGEKLLGERNL